MKITLNNDYHNTEITLLVKNGKLSLNQIKMAKRALCTQGCCCSGEVGERGPQPDGIEVEPIIDQRTGKITGAYILT